MDGASFCVDSARERRKPEVRKMLAVGAAEFHKSIVALLGADEFEYSLVKKTPLPT